MKKFIIIMFLLVTSVMSANAAFQSVGGDYTAFDLNKNFFMVNGTYKYRPELNLHYACFIHPNKERKIYELLNRVYLSEYACAEWQPEKGNLPRVPYSFYIIENEGEFLGNPDYFGQENVLYDIEAFFVNLRDYYE